jgi:hypothetical protein
MTRIAQLYFQLDSTEMTFGMFRSPNAMLANRQLRAEFSNGALFPTPHCYSNVNGDLVPYNKLKGNMECSQHIDTALSDLHNVDLFIDIMPRSGSGFFLGYRGLWTDIESLAHAGDGREV